LVEIQKFYQKNQKSFLQRQDTGNHIKKQKAMKFYELSQEEKVTSYGSDQVQQTTMY